MKALLIASIVIAAAFSTSCNTFIGLGRDLRVLGQGIEDRAQVPGKESSPNKPQQEGGAPVY